MLRLRGTIHPGGERGTGDGEKVAPAEHGSLLSIRSGAPKRFARARAG
jgi:hypothetical protein